ncbi:cell division protein FtsQ/DivIB [Ferdinandcohnia quinoae]|uniref:Cell division protein DivIB n=1 Tax=Fredinandcohnia quinoae TaxID=2918902 RepID=A0AAW5E1V8_9BACI|nr:FtsQ-type POTRA domain-containing protein [Fredinandcohnia sp. SECRCQ15]MCH1623872.1 FtsQ-type POTRA domain-containing protein [Fredinandcohnia sp. SECRCQ15]
MGKQKVITIEDRIPKLKQRRKQKANRRLILYLFIFFLLLAGILYFQSPLSKIGTISVKGNVYISDDEIIDFSGLKIGTSYWGVNKEETIDLLKTHKEIKSVHMDTILPNHIILNINEYKRIAYISRDGHFLPVVENGKIIESNEDSSVYPMDAPILVKWDDKGIKLISAELSKVPEEISNLISEIHYTPTDYDSLHITLYMNNGYEVRASVRNFAKNILTYPSIISELDPTLKGYIELDVVPTFKPYKIESTTEEKELVTDEGEG